MEGDLLTAGQMVVRFEVPELEAQRTQAQARLALAEAELDKAVNGPRPEEKDAARAAVEAARARWARLRAGWREEEKKQARSELDSAEADLKHAREEFERVDRLYRQGSVATRADWDAARANRDRALGRAAAAQARAASLEALRRLRAIGARQIYFKYCSTFDSTPAGNIGPVADALLDAMGADFTIACPAFPENGRTIYQGHLFVGRQLLSDSSMRDHPLTPMRDANLVRVLGRQTKAKVDLVPLAVVRDGAGAIQKRAIPFTAGLMSWLRAAIFAGRFSHSPPSVFMRRTTRR